MQKSTRNELADSAGSSITRPSSGIRERAGPRPSQVGKRWAVACFPPGAVGHSPIATTMLRPSMPLSFSSGYSSHPDPAVRVRQLRPFDGAPQDAARVPKGQNLGSPLAAGPEQGESREAQGADDVPHGPGWWTRACQTSTISR